MRRQMTIDCRTIGVYLALTILSALTTTVCADGPEYDLAWNTVDSGGDRSSGGDYVLMGTIGQPDAGAMTGGAYELSGGFWPGSAASIPCPADVDGDGMVDVLDLLLVLAQWGPCPPICIGDVNGDGLVDVLDLLDVLTAWGKCS